MSKSGKQNPKEQPKEQQEDQLVGPQGEPSPGPKQQVQEGGRREAGQHRNPPKGNPKHKQQG